MRGCSPRFCGSWRAGSANGNGPRSRCGDCCSHMCWPYSILGHPCSSFSFGRRQKEPIQLEMRVGCKVGSAGRLSAELVLLGTSIRSTTRQPPDGRQPGNYPESWRKLAGLVPGSRPIGSDPKGWGSGARKKADLIGVKSTTCEPSAKTLSASLRLFSSVTGHRADVGLYMLAG